MLNEWNRSAHANESAEFGLVIADEYFVVAQFNDCVCAAYADVRNAYMGFTAAANRYLSFFLVEDQDVQGSSQVVFFIQSF